MNLDLDIGQRPELPFPVTRLLGSKTGIVRMLLHYLPDRADPAVFYTTSVETDIAAIRGTDAVGSLDAGGTGLTLLDSRLRALGEAAERYCLYFPDTDRLVDASHSSLARGGATAVPFEYLDVFGPEGLDRAGLAAVDRDSELRWQAGIDLLSGERVLVPAQWVWLADAVAAGTRWYPTTSNGTACAPTLAGALVGAITERIERDAIMRTWYRQRSPKQVRLPPDDTLARLAADRFETDFRQVRFLSIESPVDVAVGGCVAVDERDRAPKFVIGGDAALSGREALRGALLETAQSWAYIKDLLTSEAGRSIDPKRIFDLEANLLHYSKPAQFDDVQPLLAGPITGIGSLGGDEGAMDESTELGHLLARLDQAGMTPIAVDVTTRDIEQVGWRVARVVIPELLDLSLPSLPPSRHPALVDHDLTEKPHPYP